MSLLKNLWDGIWTISGGRSAVEGARIVGDFGVGVVQGAALGAGGVPDATEKVATEVADYARKKANGAALLVFRAVPWWVWLAAALGLFGYFGGFAWLKRALAAKAMAKAVAA